jgi:uncharacterized SAM-binding protein YcdF (DUF218 family)
MAEVIKKNVPSERLIIENKSLKTYGNAKESLTIMRKHGWKTAVVVAQQWHARRVKATLRKMWGSDIKFCVVKAHSPYGGNSGLVMRNFLFFLIYDTLSFIFFKIKGYA